MSKAMTRSVLKEVQDFRDCVKRVVAMLSGKQMLQPARRTSAGKHPIYTGRRVTNPHERSTWFSRP
ncbi:Cobalamin biosynthesis protein CobT [Salmonella enterica subsp. enterica serovar Typhi]|nr:Cobalamin biosynthesis protein CobT [Salmonella enterica subsp. enterica serovar Typhi]